MKLKIFLLIIILFLALETAFAYNDLSIECRDIKEGQISQILLILPDNAYGTVNVTINNESYLLNINESNVYKSNGILSMPIEIEGLKSGQYNVTAQLNHQSVNDSFTVKNVKRYTFNSSDLIKDYKNESQYSVQILADGEAIGSGENVTFHINGVEYVRTTNYNGVAHLNINLEPGNYIVYSEYKTFKSYNNIRVL